MTSLKTYELWNWILIAHYDQSEFSLRFYEELYFTINSRKSSLAIPVNCI